jgi:uncharacterized phage protein (TIGR01671 family)
MREIKFRAWTKRDKCWCGAFSVHKSGLFTEMQGARMENGVCVAYADWLDLSEQEDITLTQFTGLHDKNDKEIYEGDLVRAQWGGVGQITVADGSFWMIFEDGASEEHCSSYWLHHKGIEVIGNIYENPELLN